MLTVPFHKPVLACGALARHSLYEGRRHDRCIPVIRCEQKEKPELVCSWLNSSAVSCSRQKLLIRLIHRNGWCLSQLCFQRMCRARPLLVNNRILRSTRRKIYAQLLRLPFSNWLPVLKDWLTCSESSCDPLLSVFEQSAHWFQEGQGHRRCRKRVSPSTGRS